MSVSSVLTKDYENDNTFRLPENKPNQTQFQRLRIANFLKLTPKPIRPMVVLRGESRYQPFGKLRTNRIYKGQVETYSAFSFAQRSGENITDGDRTATVRFGQQRIPVVFLVYSCLFRILYFAGACWGTAAAVT